MGTVRRIPSGEYYYFRREGNTEITVKNLDSCRAGGLFANVTTVPRELIGKKVRLKLEIVEDNHGKQ